MVRIRVLPVLGENITDGGAPTGSFASPAAAAAATAAAISSVPFGQGGGGGKSTELIVGPPVMLWLKKQTLMQHAMQSGR